MLPCNIIIGWAHTQNDVCSCKNDLKWIYCICMGYCLVKINPDVKQIYTAPCGKPPASNQVWVFGLTNSPLSTARVLTDAVGYICLESMKCGKCVCQTLGDELTLSLAETLNQDWLITLSIFFIPSQTLPCSIRQYNYIYYNQNLPLHCP